MDKAKSSSISLPESYWERLQQIADVEHGGNRTAAIRKMIDAHQSISDSAPISDLIARYSPLQKNRYKNAVELARTQHPNQLDENILLLNLLEQSISLVAQGATTHFTALGANKLKATILKGRDLKMGAEMDHFVDKIILTSKSGNGPTH